MILSKRKCPICKQPLFITNGADYHCPDCNTWPKPEVIDPCFRDWKRNEIIVDMAVERVLMGGEL